jgi:hypothetical protein
LQNAETNWQLKPKYEILLGDSSYDARNYLAQENRNIIPTRLIDTEYMETSSDTWLADFDDDGIEDVALGRLPASNEAEANQMIAKLIRYDEQAVRAAKSDVLVSDRYFENYSDALQSDLPNNVEAIRIDRSAMTDAEMRSQILAKLSDDPMVVTYTGHGSTGVWSSSSIFGYADAENLDNSQLSFYMLMTCLNGFAHNTNGDSLAEAALKAENGASAVWASSGVIIAEGQIQMSRKATQLIFSGDGGSLRIGDIARQAKASTNDMDVRRTWQIMGDPTIFVK